MCGRSREQQGDIAMEQVNEQQVMKKIFWRLTPMMVFLYIVSYLDRVNVGFAALTMNKDIGLSPYMYGLGAGIFFWGYFIFEIPSNLIMAKVGARRWIARILFSWGLVAVAMAWVKGPTSFLTMRFILGVAEAGFFPGVILYWTYWFPARYRARIISYFMLGIPLSFGIGGPISTGIMQLLNGVWGLKGWQWLFIAEGLPAIVLPVVVLFVLPDRPSDAGWLTAAEKKWLEHELEADRETVAVKKTESSAARSLMNPMVWAMCIIYFARTGANYGLGLFMPQIIKVQGYSNLQTGWIMLVPYVIGCIAMLAFGWSSDRRKERKWHLIIAFLLIVIGLWGAGLAGPTTLSLGLLCIATIGINGSNPPFWPLPSAYVTGAGAAAGIALVNSVGNLGGFAGPYMLGWAKQFSTNFSGGLYMLGCLGILGAVMTLLVVKSQKTGAPAPPSPEKKESVQTR
jgi:ACS family tartrate transporter-like MFS transporter